MIQKFIIPLILLVVLVSSCSKEEDQIQPSDTKVEIRQEQHTNQDLFDPCEAANLFVFVNLSACNEGTLWECAVERAIESYDELDCGIGIGMTMITDMNDLPAGETINISIECDATGQNTFGGGGTMFRNGSGGLSQVFIETDFQNNWPCTGITPSCCQMQKIVMHEIGHALSIGHTQGGSGWGAQHITGTPMGEPNSIFNTSGKDGWCKSICDFTEGDLLTLELLYPSSDCEDICSEIHNVDISANGNLAPGQTINVTSSPSDRTEYTVWAVFEGIPTRFFVHQQCGDQPLTTQFTLQNDPIMECSLEIYVVQCGDITNSKTYSLGSISSIYPSISDSYPQLGEEVEIKTVCNGKADYSVRLKYELYGQVQYQTVENVNCNSTSTSLVTLWSNPGLAYKTVTIEGVRNGSVIGTQSFTIFP